jgi:hypothetical protein
MGTAEETATDLYAVTNNPTVAVLANGRNGLNRAFEASNVCRSPAAISSKDLSYSLPHTSHLDINSSFVFGSKQDGRDVDVVMLCAVVESATAQSVAP